MFDDFFSFAEDDHFYHFFSGKTFNVPPMFTDEEERALKIIVEKIATQHKIEYDAIVRNKEYRNKPKERGKVLNELNLKYKNQIHGFFDGLMENYLKLDELSCYEIGLLQWKSSMVNFR